MSIAPNPADLPSPANRYRLPERVHATSDLFNLVFGSIGARLDAAEGKSADYDAAIDRIIGQALQTVSAALTVEIAAGRAEFEAVRAAFEELQSGGFSAARIAATLNGHPTVTHVQGALTTLLGLVRDLDALLPDVGETDGLKFLRAKADRSGFELAEVDLYSAALVQRVARSANVQIVKADKGKLFVLTGTFTQTVVSPATLGAGHHYLVKNAGNGVITVPASDGLANWPIYSGELRLFVCDGATLRSEVLVPFRRTWTANGTYVHPPGYAGVIVSKMNGGASGGNGRQAVDSNSATPGAAGVGGAYEITERPVRFAPGASRSVTVGAGGQPATVAGATPVAGGVSGLQGVVTSPDPARTAGNGGAGATGVSTSNGTGGLPGSPGSVAFPDGIDTGIPAAAGGAAAARGSLRGNNGASGASPGYGGGGGSGVTGTNAGDTNIAGNGGPGAFPGGGGGGGGGTVRASNNFTSTDFASGGPGAAGMLEIEGVI